MSSIIKRVVKKIRTAAIKKQSHGDLIRETLENAPEIMNKKTPVFVETGCGITTITLSEVGERSGAVIYSCDYNPEKADALKVSSAGKVSNVVFMIGDSIASLTEIAANHDQIDFLFLDSAASAMHTFREFMTVENCLKPGSRLLIDNAALPGEKAVLGPVRKGKILVPYLLASPFWEVSGYPGAGDSMVGAVMHSAPDYADTAYEDSEYIDNWRALFNRKLS